MGLLTDPSAGQGRITKALLTYYSKLCVLLYVAGIAWFLSLSHRQVNLSTYFSENALLPGLVKSEFRDESSARQYYTELMDEMEKYDDAIPYPWLLAKFRQIGLDVYTHNFTLNHILGRPQKFSGKNVYGILRAARASSIESVVLNVPYRPPKSVHAKTAASIAIMLAFAKFANKEKYWSKDIIFLVTEHEQLGVQAWLEAYHSVSCGKKGILEHGDLKGRGGAIQAAINLELHDISIAQIDIKIEGLNGQLPNLDLFNLANKMCIKEGVLQTFKNRTSKNLRDPFKDWYYAFQTLLAMMTTQATGVPNGNHGLFHRFGIEALTMEGFPTSAVRGSSKVGFITIGRILEGIYRSLNNLLERFHQSYFFYLLPAADRFVSIGLYMPSICIIAGALFIKACALWYKLQENSLGNNNQSDDDDDDDDDKEEKFEKKPKVVENLNIDQLKAAFEKELILGNETNNDDINFVSIGTVFILVHIIGVLVMSSPYFVTRIGVQYGFSTDHSVFVGFTMASLLLLFAPFFISIKTCRRSMSVLNILCLLELGTALICVSMNNFSLAFICGVIYVPLALLIKETTCRYYSFLQKVLWFMVQPFLFLTLVVVINTFFTFPADPVKENILHGIRATMQAVTYSIVDSFIYGNWLFSVITTVFFPNWLCFWCVAFTKIAKDDSISDDKKRN